MATQQSLAGYEPVRSVAAVPKRVAATVLPLQSLEAAVTGVRAASRGDPLELGHNAITTGSAAPRVGGAWLGGPTPLLMTCEDTGPVVGLHRSPVVAAAGQQQTQDLYLVNTSSYDDVDNDDDAHGVTQPATPEPAVDTQALTDVECEVAVQLEQPMGPSAARVVRTRCLDESSDSDADDGALMVELQRELALQRHVFSSPGGDAGGKSAAPAPKDVVSPTIDPPRDVDWQQRQLVSQVPLAQATLDMDMHVDTDDPVLIQAAEDSQGRGGTTVAGTAALECFLLSSQSDEDNDDRHAKAVNDAGSEHLAADTEPVQSQVFEGIE